MFKMTIRNLTALLALAATPAFAQEGLLPLPIERLLTLAEQPHLNGTQFEQSMNKILPFPAYKQALPKLPYQDPFLWFFRPTLEGQIYDQKKTVQCSRHGLATHSWFARKENQDSLTGVVLGFIPSLTNGPILWPENAVAKLNCEIFFRDIEKYFTGLTETDARAALSVFQSFSEPMEPDMNTLIYGPDGYSVEAFTGTSNTVMHVDRARLVRIGNGYVFVFSSFLLAGVS